MRSDKEILEQIKMFTNHQADIANDLKISPTHLNAVLNGKAKLARPTRMLLESWINDKIEQVYLMSLKDKTN